MIKNSTKSTLFKYWSEVRRHWLATVLIVVGVIGGATTGSIIPLYVRDLFNVLTSNAPNKSETLMKILAIFAALQFLGWAFWRLATFVNSYFQNVIMADLASRCFQYLHRHSFGFFN